MVIADRSGPHDRNSYHPSRLPTPASWPACQSSQVRISPALSQVEVTCGPAFPRLGRREFSDPPYMRGAASRQIGVNWSHRFLGMPPDGGVAAYSAELPPFLHESCFDMCILAIQYQLVSETPILVAANREEAFDRPSLPPSIQSGKPRVLCGTDQKAGGTWLGVNQHGLLVAACNRPEAFTARTPGIPRDAVPRIAALRFLAPGRGYGARRIVHRQVRRRELRDCRFRQRLGGAWRGRLRGHRVGGRAEHHRQW